MSETESIYSASPGVFSVNNKEELLLRLTQMLEGAQMMVMGTIDNSNRLMIGTLGLDKDQIALAFRHIAQHVERDHAMQSARERLNAIPTNCKGSCPQCGQLVVLVKDIPEAMMTTPNHQAICVCACGAFLLPSLDEARQLLLRFLTIEEIAELPDDIRMELIRTRNSLMRHKEAATSPPS